MDKVSLRSVIEESKKIRDQRGADFFENKKITIAWDESSKIHKQEDEKHSKILQESHFKLTEFINEYDQKIFDQNSRELTTKKKRSKSIHLYVDEEIENFLETESKNSQSKWGLRKNAGLGSLIQKFILNFIELKKREERQLKKVKKLIDDFRSNLVDFKILSANDYEKAEEINQKMKVISNDLRIIISLFEFTDEDLALSLGKDIFPWINFIVQWKYQS